MFSAVFLSGSLPLMKHMMTTRMMTTSATVRLLLLLPTLPAAAAAVATATATVTTTTTTATVTATATMTTTAAAAKTRTPTLMREIMSCSCQQGRRSDRQGNAPSVAAIYAQAQYSRKVMRMPLGSYIPILFLLLDPNMFRSCSYQNPTVFLSYSYY